MLKWLAGIAATVISAVIIWLVTKPPQSLPPKPPSSLSGKWTYTMRSDVSHNNYRGSLQLLMDGTNVSGEFVEDFFDASNRGLRGSIWGGDDLELQRDIRSKNTTQQYSLKKESDNKFAGTFWNVSPPENRDQGIFEITRQGP
jgi:hypothetical protein